MAVRTNTAPRAVTVSYGHATVRLAMTGTGDDAHEGRAAAVDAPGYFQ